MKKFLALMVTVALLLTSVSAFAIGPGPNTQSDSSTTPDVDAQMTVGTATDTYNGTSPDGDTHTQLWLQVDGAMGGTIDVTVPLVLVFRTSIDGGEADTATNYGITNNSTAPVAITAITTTTDDATSNMTNVPYTAAKITALDTYATLLETGAHSWDLNTAKYTESAVNGGLFTIGNNGAKTPLKLTMKTGPLSFVTKADANGNADITKGVKILTVAYTVALNTSDDVTRGETITTDSVLHPDDDANLPANH